LGHFRHNTNIKKQAVTVFRCNYDAESYSLCSKSINIYYLQKTNYQKAVFCIWDAHDIFTLCCHIPTYDWCYGPATHIRASRWTATFKVDPNMKTKVLWSNLTTSCCLLDNLQSWEHVALSTLHSRHILYPFLNYCRRWLFKLCLIIRLI
jgi:hypothetical protein